MLTPEDQTATDVPIRVTIMLHRNGGRQAAIAARTRNVWLVDSPENKEIAKAYWAERRDGTGSLTLFQPYGQHPEEWAVAVLGAVEQHHGQFAQRPSYQEVEILGCHADAALTNELAELGFKVIESSAQHLLAAREA